MTPPRPQDLERNLCKADIIRMEVQRLFRQLGDGDITTFSLDLLMAYESLRSRAAADPEYIMEWMRQISKEGNRFMRDFKRKKI